MIRPIDKARWKNMGKTSIRRTKNPPLCPVCNVPMTVYCTKEIIRYLKCPLCLEQRAKQSR